PLRVLRALRGKKQSPAPEAISGAGLDYSYDACRTSVPGVLPEGGTVLVPGPVDLRLRDRPQEVVLLNVIFGLVVPALHHLHQLAEPLQVEPAVALGVQLTGTLIQNEVERHIGRGDLHRSLHSR